MCIRDRNYVGAAEIADTINWNKIKNINTLVKAGEIYEKAERYDDARDIPVSYTHLDVYKRQVKSNQLELKSQLQDLSDTDKYLKIIEDRNREIQRQKDAGKPKKTLDNEASIYANRRTEIKVNKDYIRTVSYTHLCLIVYFNLYRYVIY